MAAGVPNKNSRSGVGNAPGFSSAPVFSSLRGPSTAAAAGSERGTAGTGKRMRVTFGGEESSAAPSQRAHEPQRSRGSTESTSRVPPPSLRPAMASRGLAAATSFGGPDQDAGIARALSTKDGTASRHHSSASREDRDGEGGARRVGRKRVRQEDDAQDRFEQGFFQARTGGRAGGEVGRASAAPARTQAPAASGSKAVAAYSGAAAAKRAASALFGAGGPVDAKWL